MSRPPSRFFCSLKGGGFLDSALVGCSDLGDSGTFSMEVAMVDICSEAGRQQVLRIKEGQKRRSRRYDPSLQLNGGPNKVDDRRTSINLSAERKFNLDDYPDDCSTNYIGER